MYDIRLHRTQFIHKSHKGLLHIRSKPGFSPASLLPRVPSVFVSIRQATCRGEREKMNSKNPKMDYESCACCDRERQIPVTAMDVNWENITEEERKSRGKRKKVEKKTAMSEWEAKGEVSLGAGCGGRKSKGCCSSASIQQLVPNPLGRTASPIPSLAAHTTEQTVGVHCALCAALCSCRDCSRVVREVILSQFMHDTPLILGCFTPQCKPGYIFFKCLCRSK